MLQSTQRIADLYNRAGYRLEALGVVMWTKQKPDLFATIERMYGGGRIPQQETFNRLETQIKDKLDAKSVAQLLRRELQPNSVATTSSQSFDLSSSMLVPDLRIIAERNEAPAIYLRELMSRLNEDSKEKTSLQQLLGELAANNWADVSNRGFISALYLSDYLQQKDYYVAAARALNERLLAESSRNTTSADEKEARAAGALRPAYWLVAEKLIEYDQANLAQAFAKQALAGEEPVRLHSLNMQLRFAQSLVKAKQQPAAEAQMRELLNRLYPAKANEHSANGR